MKSVFESFFFIVFIIVSFALSCFSSEKTVAQEEKKHYLSFIDYLNGIENRILSSDIFLKGIIVDEDGKVVDNVRILVECERQDIATLISTGKEKYVRDKEEKKCSGEFVIKKNGYSDISVIFKKEGYYDERLQYQFNSREEDKRIRDENIRIVLRKHKEKANVSYLEFMHFQDKLDANNDRVIFDLSSFAAHQNRPQKRTKEELPKDCYIEISLRHIELGTQQSTQSKESYKTNTDLQFVIRMISSNKDDGFIFIDGWDKHMQIYREFLTHYTEAPKSLYSLQEIIIPQSKMVSKNTSLDYCPSYFFRCGEHYGKITFSELDFRKKGNDYFFSFCYYFLINNIIGDRNLTAI
jgi:hypothetical protein